MKDVHLTLFGFALAAGVGVCITIYQAKPVIRDGEQRYVVAWVRKNRVVETPVLKRCLVVGLGCGILGGVTGNRIGTGGGVIPTAVGAGLGLGLALYIEGQMPNQHGVIGQQGEHLTRVFGALLGAVVGASASAWFRRIVTVAPAPGRRR